MCLSILCRRNSDSRRAARLVGSTQPFLQTARHPYPQAPPRVRVGSTNTGGELGSAPARGGAAAPGGEGGSVQGADAVRARAGWGAAGERRG